MAQERFTSRQLAFKELFVGTLIYAVTLGFFNDYTAIVSAKSFSTIFYASILLQMLTMAAFWLKGRLVAWLKDRQGVLYRALMFFSVWLVMFLSKFIFVGAVDLVFGDYVTIYGFFGILAVVAVVTVVHRLADIIFKRLGSQ